MTTRYVRLVLNVETLYNVEEDEEFYGPFENDGIPWTEQQIINWFKEHWAEQLTSNMGPWILDHIKGEMDYRD